MIFPAEAFFAAEAREVPAGHFYLKDGNWFISVDANQGQGGYMSAVQLTGDLVGLFLPNPVGVSTYIGGGWTVEARIEWISETVDGQRGNWNAALVLGDKPYLYAQYGQGDRFFGLDGIQSNGSGLSDSRRRFTQWSGWMVGPDGDDIGDQPLFEVVSVPRIY